MSSHVKRRVVQIGESRGVTISKEWLTTHGDPKELCAIPGSCFILLVLPDHLARIEQLFDNLMLSVIKEAQAAAGGHP